MRAEMIRLCELRKDKELSQRDIAKKFSVSQSAYNNWENGKAEPSISQILKIAEFFGVSVDYLIGNSDDLGNIVYKESYLKSSELELLNIYRQLSPPAQQSILDFIKNSFRY